MGARSRKRGRTAAPRPPAAEEPPRAASKAAASRPPAPEEPPHAAPEDPSPPPPAVPAESPPAPSPEAPPEPAALPNRYARGRARDEAIRQSLEPLAPGERPRIVTIAAIVAFAFAIANLVATLTGDDLSSDQGDPTTFAIVTTSILVLAGIGMLARKYWAVLGFQCILGLQIVVFSLALTRVQKWWVGLGLVVAIGLLGLLFWKLIRAMARLQMPDRPGSAQSTR